LQNLPRRSIYVRGYFWGPEVPVPEILTGRIPEILSGLRKETGDESREGGGV
jgi:hypothetical protein